MNLFYIDPYVQNQSWYEVMCHVTFEFTIHPCEVIIYLHN